jgi:hypothetical protein
MVDNMWHISSATIALLVLGALLVILAGFSNGSVPPIGFWGLYGQYILLMAGVTLIIAAAVLFLRERRTH